MRLPRYCVTRNDMGGKGWLLSGHVSSNLQPEGDGFELHQLDQLLSYKKSKKFAKVHNRAAGDVHSIEI